MAKILNKILIPLSVFITGSCVLIIEIVAVRALSPHYGNTIFTVSSVISVILAALSFGYYFGGRLSDKHPSAKWFFSIIALSGILVIFFNFLGTIILPALSSSLSLSFGPLVSSVILFLLPSFLLGTLSPYAIKIQSIRFPEQGVGKISGTIFFWSTLGSITGSLGAGFMLIPNFGIDTIFLSTGVVLILLGIIPLFVLLSFKNTPKWLLITILALSLLTTFKVEPTEGNIVYEKDGIYEKIVVYDEYLGLRPVRFFKQDKSASGAMFLDSDDPTDLVYDYTKYYSLYEIFRSDLKNVLVIGGGAYSIPKAIGHKQPEAIIEVSEIEPSLFGLAKKYFDLKESANIINRTEDGRRLLKDSDKKYDLIFSDVYYSLFSIPPHFTTREFFQIAKDKLSSDGIFMANLIGNISRQEPSLILSEIRTFKEVFPNSYFVAVQSSSEIGAQNIIFVGYNSEKKIDLSSNFITKNKNPIISSFPEKLIDLNRFELSAYPVLSDQFSPVEHMTATILKKNSSEISVDGNEILATIEQQLRYGPRFMGSEGRNRVQDFLIAEMDEFSDSAFVQSWEYKATDGKNYLMKNIIGRFDPSNKKRIILATHYDTKRLADLDPKNPSQPIPGANDSASGTAVLLEIARVLKNSYIKPSVGIDIIFFDGEEGDINQNRDYSQWIPLGSNYFSKNLDDFYKESLPGEAIVLDMVCDKNLIIPKEPASLRHAKTQVETFWKIAERISPKIFVESIGEEIADDHTSLNKAGIPSFLLIDYTYPPFHTTADTLDKCSAENLGSVARSVLGYIFYLN